MAQIKCVCGEEQSQALAEHPGMVIMPDGSAQAVVVPTVECVRCRVVRQINLPFSTEEEYTEFYKSKYPPTGQDYAAKDYTHDRFLAGLRCKNLNNITAGKRVLDIGSGSGAFVDECRRHGAEAYGCDLASYKYEREGGFVYRNCLENINFPTDHFDVVTCFDTIEHVLNPVQFIKEIFRIVKQEGNVVIEMPRFFHDSGRHHWKLVEHIWYFTVDQLEQLLCTVGFENVEVSYPVESKVSFYAQKPLQNNRPKILVPPGIGDSYWSIVKMRAFLEREKLALPDIYIACPRDKEYEGHKRAFPFLEMFPFLNSTGETREDPPGVSKRRVWVEAYVHAGRTVFRDVLGCDYFLSWNGHLRIGKKLEDVDLDLKCEWFPPMFESLEQTRFRDACVKQYGRYIVFYFVFMGTNSKWLQKFPALIDYILAVAKKVECIPVFAGAKWDDQRDHVLKNIRACVKAAMPQTVDLVGQTSVPQLFGLLKGAQAVVGSPSGLTVMSTVFKQKTMILWHGYFHPNFMWNVCPPSTRGETYFAENVEAGLSLDYLTSRTADLITGQRSVRPMSVNVVASSGSETARNAEELADKDKTVVPTIASVIATIETSEKVRWKKIGGGSFRLANGRIIKPNQVFLASINEIPVGFRDVIVKLPDSSSSRPSPIVEVANLAKPAVVGNDSVAVVCVLKSGGDYTLDYVRRLRSMVERNTTIPYKFICFTDVNLNGNCERVPLICNYPGWWSKLELFRPGLIKAERFIYFDLDTVIVGNIDSLLQLHPTQDFVMLKEWNGRQHARGQRCSGVMSWKNDGSYSFIHDEFQAGDVFKYPRGDQDYLSKTLPAHGKKIIVWQDILRGFYSYKHECRGSSNLPADARVICFHGKPRPNKVTESWMAENWR